MKPGRTLQRLGIWPYPMFEKNLLIFFPTQHPPAKLFTTLSKYESRWLLCLCLVWKVWGTLLRTSHLFGAFHLLHIACWRWIHSWHHEISVRLGDRNVSWRHNQMPASEESCEQFTPQDEIELRQWRASSAFNNLEGADWRWQKSWCSFQ